MCKMSVMWIAALAVWGVCGCAHTATSYSRQENSELREYKHVKKLVVATADSDERASAIYRIKISEDAEIQRAVRTVAEVTVKEYPFSGARKIDDLFIGIVGAPFAPLAILGGLANGETDLMLFPLSAWNPLANFRPDKGGLFSGPISPRYQQYSEKSDWQYQPATHTVQPYVGSLLVKTDGNSLQASTDATGVATVDLVRLLGGRMAAGDVTISVHTASDMVCTHLIPAARLASIARPKSVPAQTDPQPSRPQPASQRPPVVKAPQQVPVQAAPRTMPTSRQLAVSSLMPVVRQPKAGQLLLYKAARWGYWVNNEGVAVLALPTHADVQLYADEFLHYPTKKQLRFGKAYYVFAFTFDPVNQIALAAKVGIAPREEECAGWVSAQDTMLWQTLYLVAVKDKITLYPTQESCRQGNSQQAFTVDVRSAMPALPVIEQRDKLWCLACPDTQGQGDTLRLGWLSWDDSSGSRLQVRVMKHKLDVALKFLENKIIQGNQQPNEQFELALQGPLCLQQMTGEMFLASFNKESQENETVQGQFLDIPSQSPAIDEFQETILTISNELLKKNLWEGDDVVFLPVE